MICVNQYETNCARIVGISILERGHKRCEGYGQLGPARWPSSTPTDLTWEAICNSGLSFRPRM